MKRKSKRVAVRSSLFLLTQCLQVTRSCRCLVRRPLSVTSTPKSFPVRQILRTAGIRLSPVWRRACDTCHLSGANELSYLMEDVTLNKTAAWESMKAGCAVQPRPQGARGGRGEQRWDRGDGRALMGPGGTSNAAVCRAISGSSRKALSQTASSRGGGDLQRFLFCPGSGLPGACLFDWSAWVL